MKIVCTHQHRQFENIWDYEAFLQLITSPDMYNVVGDEEALTVDWDNPTPANIRTLEDVPSWAKKEEDFFYLEVDNNPYEDD